MDVNDVMHRKRARGILGILKKSVVLSLAVRRRRVTFASSQWPCGGCHTCWANGKACIERLCLSPYVEKPFNSKVIKSFIPELRSRKCFSFFGIPMFYVYMLCTFPISVSGYGTKHRLFRHFFNEIHYIWYQVFLSHKNNLHTVVWFQLFLFDTHDFKYFCLIRVIYLYIFI